MGVNRGGDTDEGVAKEFFDDDEFDALFQREGRAAESFRLWRRMRRSLALQSSVAKRR